MGCWIATLWEENPIPPSEGEAILIYMVPGVLAGIVFYLFLTVVNAMVERIWSKKRRLRAHTRLVIHCFVTIAFTIFIVFAGGGGSWGTHMQIAGFLLAGCLLSFMTALNDRSPYRGEN